VNALDVVPVVSLGTPNPRRVHLMDEDGEVLCRAMLRFRRHDSFRDHGVRTCCPCHNIYLRHASERAA
jgi:hypothetical protein